MSCQVGYYSIDMYKCQQYFVYKHPLISIFIGVILSVIFSFGIYYLAILIDKAIKRREQGE